MYHQDTIYSRLALEDAGRQIRLLKYSSPTGATVMGFDLSIWDLKDAPLFTAISYTWGGVNDFRDILINDAHFSLLVNCQYALRQAQQHIRDGYLWIDSLCINQQNLDEKAMQVQMMYEIFSRAAKVLSCIGPPRNDTDLLSLVAKDLCRMEIQPWIEGTGEMYSWIARQKLVFLRWLAQTVAEFAQRRYWSRMWIVQEIFSAVNAHEGQARLRVLCGNLCLTWYEVQMLVFATQSCMTILSVVDQHDIDEEGEESLQELRDIKTLPLYRLLTTQLNGMTIDRAFTLFGSHGCTDPRDHLFALYNLIDWQDHRPVPKVDYRKSVTKVALEVIDFLDFQGIICMLRAFDLTADSTILNDLLSIRRPDHMRGSDCYSGPEDTNWSSFLRELERCDEGEPTHEDTREIWTFCGNITAGINGQLVLDFVHFGSENVEATWSLHDSDLMIQNTERARGVPSLSVTSQVRGRMNFEDFDSFYRSDNMKLQYDPASLHTSPISFPTNGLVLRADDQIAAILCSTACLDDIVLALPSQGSIDKDTEQNLLVLRRDNSGKLNIIGQGFTVNGFRIAEKPMKYRDEVFCKSFRLSSFDLLLFIAQDLSNDTHTHRQNRAWRLVTSVASGEGPITPTDEASHSTRLSSAIFEGRHERQHRLEAREMTSGRNMGNTVQINDQSMLPGEQYASQAGIRTHRITISTFNTELVDNEIWAPSIESESP